MNKNELSFEFNPIKYPYQDSLLTKRYWGIIRLIHKGSNESYSTLLDWQWDVSEVRDWYYENRNCLLVEEFPFRIDGKESIAECRDRLYQKMDFKTEEEEESYFESLENYFYNHVFHLRGTDTHTFYLGLKEGKGEISYFDYSLNLYYVYEFEMEKFLSSTDYELKKFESKIG